MLADAKQGRGLLVRTEDFMLEDCLAMLSGQFLRLLDLPYDLRWRLIAPRRICSAKSLEIVAGPDLGILLGKRIAM